MSFQAKRELLAQVAPRYQRARHVQKSVILDEFVAATGYDRKYTIRLLTRPPLPAPARIRRPRAPHYGQAVQPALEIAWAAANLIRARRLIPFLPTLVPVLEQHGHLTVTAEVRTDLLALSCRDNVAGAFVSTLVLTDVATGWVECQTLLFRSSDQVLQGLTRATQLFPFPLRGLDTDNGGEFITNDMLDYCARAQITFTRGRQHCSNDQCYVEQKNGAVVRQFVGYDRFEGLHAYRQLIELYRALRLYVNFFQPSLKLEEKVREGTRTRRRYLPAQTSFERLCAAQVLEDAAHRSRDLGQDPDLGRRAHPRGHESVRHQASVSLALISAANLQKLSCSQLHHRE